MYRRIKVAAISMRPARWDKAGNADRLERLFRRAARRKVDLIVAPEGVLDGYVIMEALRQPKKLEAIRELAEPIDGPYIKRFQRLARSLRTCLAFGFAERVDGDVYNAAIFIDRRGRICGKYHKTQFAEGTLPEWWFNRVGKKLRAFDTPLGRAGFVICNDRWNPDIARAIALDGARYLMICTYGTRNAQQDRAVLARSRENGIPIVQANVGCNVIISKGELVAREAGFDRITYGEIDIPSAPSTRAARQAERDYLTKQGPFMEKRARGLLRFWARQDRARRKKKRKRA